VFTQIWVATTSVRKQNRTEQNRTEQNRTEQNRAEQSRAEQSRAEQSRAEQSTAEQSRAEQNRAESRPKQAKVIVTVSECAGTIYECAVLSSVSVEICDNVGRCGEYERLQHVTYKQNQGLTAIHGVVKQMRASFQQQNRRQVKMKRRVKER
jgi:hypothetical protein